MMVEYKKESGCFWIFRCNKRYAAAFSAEQFLRLNKELIVRGQI